MTDTHIDIERLHDVIPGQAVFGTGTTTFGTWADGGHVSMLLTDGNRARNKLIVGGSGSGKTELLESLYLGAVRAGVDVDLADPLQRSDVAAIIGDAQILIDDRDRDGSGGWPLRLLLVDHLREIDGRTGDLLARVARMGPKVNVATVVATQGSSVQMPGGVLLRDSLAAGGVIEFRVVENGLPARFADGTTTAGVGMVNGDLFRAWWPGT